MDKIRAVALTAIVLALAGLGVATWSWVVAATDDDPLAGLGYAYAVLLALPLVPGLVLAGAALAVHRTRPRAALVLVSASSALVGLVAVLVALGSALLLAP